MRGRPTGAPPRRRFYARRGSALSPRSAPATLIALTALALTAACRAPDPGARDLHAPPATPVDAPWTYLDAAVHSAALQHELVILDQIDPRPPTDSPGAPSRVYRLLGARDERVRILADRAGDRVARLGVEWRPFRDPTRERALLRTLRHRLADLTASGGIAPPP